jgi:hypothetical protein
LRDNHARGRRTWSLRHPSGRRSRRCRRLLSRRSGSRGPHRGRCRGGWLSCNWRRRSRRHGECRPHWRYRNHQSRGRHRMWRRSCWWRRRNHWGSRLWRDRSHRRRFTFHGRRMRRDYRTRRNYRRTRRRYRRSLLLAQRIQYIAWLGDVGKIIFGLERLVCLRTAGPGRFARSVTVVTRVEMRSYFVSFEILERTGMRFFLGDPQPRQRIGDRLAFDFQLSRQIVDSNLTHPPLFSSPSFPPTRSYLPHRTA